MTDHTLLPDRAVLSITGEDTIPFLQGLVTNNLRQVEEEQSIYAALLTPQGKFLHDFFIIPRDGGVWLELRREGMADLIKRLTMYRLRARVTFEERPDLAVAAEWGKKGLGIGDWGVVRFADPRHPLLGKRAIGPKETANNIVNDPELYDLHRLRLGIPEGGADLIPDKSLLLEYGIDHLHGIDFGKGCYVGQEVTARTKHRATLRKMIFKVTGETPLPEAGTKLMAGDREVGEMRSSQGAIGLALLNAEAVEQSGNALQAGGMKLEAVKPDWLGVA